MKMKMKMKKIFKNKQNKNICVVFVKIIIKKIIIMKTLNSKRTKKI